MSPSESRPGATDLPFEAVRIEATLSLLQSGVPHRSRLHCWTAGQGHSHTSRIVKVHESAGLKSISVSKENEGGEEFEAALLREGVEEILFSLHLPTDTLFFRGELRRGESGTFTARVKEPIYKVQRRGSLRLPVPSQPPNWVTFAIEPDATVERKARLLNVSDGGVSLITADDSLYRSAPKGTALTRLVFSLGAIDVLATGVVRHSEELPGPGAKERFRLGVQFTAVDPKIRERLSRQIIEESSKFVGRL